MGTNKTPLWIMLKYVCENSFNRVLAASFLSLGFVYIAKKFLFATDETKKQDSKVSFSKRTAITRGVASNHNSPEGYLNLNQSVNEVDPKPSARPVHVKGVEEGNFSHNSEDTELLYTLPYVEDVDENSDGNGFGDHSEKEDSDKKDCQNECVVLNWTAVTREATSHKLIEGDLPIDQLIKELDPKPSAQPVHVEDVQEGNFFHNSDEEDDLFPFVEEELGGNPDGSDDEQGGGGGGGDEGSDNDGSDKDSDKKESDKESDKKESDKESDKDSEKKESDNESDKKSTDKENSGGSSEDESTEKGKEDRDEQDPPEDEGHGGKRRHDSGSRDDDYPILKRRLVEGGETDSASASKHSGKKNRKKSSKKSRKSNGKQQCGESDVMNEKSNVEVPKESSPVDKDPETERLPLSTVPLHFTYNAPSYNK